MSDFWHKLGCCVVEKPQPVSSFSLAGSGGFGALGPWAQRGLTAFLRLQKKRRRRIDRSMIGEPMNFVHLTHIGSGDMAAGEGLPMVPCPRARSGCWVVRLGGGVSQLGGGYHGWVLGVVVGWWVSVLGW